MLNPESLARLGSASDLLSSRDTPSVRGGGSAPASAVGGDPTNVKAMIRVRPFNSAEIALSQADYVPDFPVLRPVLYVGADHTVTVVDPDSNWKAVEAFAFDRVFWSVPREQFEDIDPAVVIATQTDVDAFVGAPAVEAVLSGRNGCVFAYGQTGSGKTHTMMGYANDPGLIPKIIQRLFSLVADSPPHLEHVVSASFLEIYNEKVRDLLDAAAMKAKEGNFSDRKVRYTPTLGAYVEGLRRTTITSVEECDAVLVAGTTYRTTASTKMNDTSSRSHAILQLHVKKTDKHSGFSRFAVLNLVDLAGSERLRMSGVSGAQLKEAKNINLSLTTLRRVIDTLLENANRSARAKPSVVPYRESMLTWVLSDSLGGNCQTTMLGMMSPHLRSFEDTVNTLRYCLRAKAIMCHVKVNEEKSKVVMGALKAEMDALRKAQDDAAERARLEAMQREQQAVEEEEARQKAMAAKKIQSVAAARAQATLAKHTATLRKLHEELEARTLMQDESMKFDAEKAAMEDLTEEHAAVIEAELERIRQAEIALAEAEEKILQHQREAEELAAKEAQAQAAREVEYKKELANVFRMAAKFGRDEATKRELTAENASLRASCEAKEEHLRRIARRQRSAKDVALLLGHHYEEALSREQQLKMAADDCADSKARRLQELKLAIDSEEAELARVKEALSLTATALESKYHALEIGNSTLRAKCSLASKLHCEASKESQRQSAKLDALMWENSAYTALVSNARSHLEAQLITVSALIDQVEALVAEEDALKADISNLEIENQELKSELARVTSELPTTHKRTDATIAIHARILRADEELTSFVRSADVIFTSAASVAEEHEVKREPSTRPDDPPPSESISAW